MVGSWQPGFRTLDLFIIGTYHGVGWDVPCPMKDADVEKRFLWPPVIQEFVNWVNHNLIGKSSRNMPFSEPFSMHQSWQGKIHHCLSICR
jgi:hypothetical protein